ncbi:MAG: glycerol-3-phosphate dehydrogenase, partial [Gammaproteobacteria bacterium]
MEYDIVVIGGGINGAAIAADAAGRGLKVFLCEKNDFASGTSSASSKLIHGGLRYLEQYDFKLVRESLHERNILLKRAPHLVFPIPFVMPDNAAYHSPFIIGLGLWLYDFLAHDKMLPKAKRINLNQLPPPSHLKKASKGYQYTDCWGDDARLVIANLQLARQKGAEIASRTELLTAVPIAEGWLVTLLKPDQTTQQITTKVIINATGPWADTVKQRLAPSTDIETDLSLVKGSHIVIKKFYQGNHAFILQNADGRIVFLIPFQQDLLIVGTTDVAYQGDPAKVAIDAQEIAYLQAVVQQYFDVDMSKEKIVWQYSGVRPLYDDHRKNVSKISRDYHITSNHNKNALLLTIYGGKLTTHRFLAEDVMKKLKSTFPHLGDSWTKTAVFPGGNINNNFDTFLALCQQQYSWLPIALVTRLAHDYGSNINELLSGAQKLTDLGENFGADLYEREVRYLVQNEWAQTAEDIVWRRTKQGLHLTQE